VGIYRPAPARVPGPPSIVAIDYARDVPCPTENVSEDQKRTTRLPSVGSIVANGLERATGWFGYIA